MEERGGDRGGRGRLGMRGGGEWLRVGRKTGLLISHGSSVQPAALYDQHHASPRTQCRVLKALNVL